MTRVGYLEGTDPWFLSELVARGIDTIPLSNGVDNHGKFVGHITKADEIDLIVCFLHKVIPLADSGITSLDILHSCQIREIPVLVIAKKSIHDKAKAILGEAASIVTLVDPADLRTEFGKALG